MPKKCYNCGMIKKTTFKCAKCKKIICLGCYVFTNCLCVNCDSEAYNEEYKEKISAYVQGGEI